MTDVEKIALWLGLVSSIVSIVLSVVAIVFARMVDKSARDVSDQTIRSLQKIEGYVERLSSDTTGLIKAGWDRMLGNVGSPPNDVSGSAKEMAAGLLAEMRAQLGLSETGQRDSHQELSKRDEELDDALKGMRGALEAQLRTQKRSDRPSEVLDDVSKRLRSLTPEARALAALIGPGRHLTFDQFQHLLKDSSLSDAVSELRDEGLLVPLEGYSRIGKPIPVYYFPSGLSDIVRAALLLMPEVDAELRAFVAAELEGVGYKPR
jgi:hypothetical protein